MAKSQADLTKWALQKSAEYLESAKINLDSNRLYPAAEEVFRSTENSLEAMLYSQGVRIIEYPGTRGKFTGRLALQFLVRDNLMQTGIITDDTYRQYMDMANELHRAGYQPHLVFQPETVTIHAKLAEELLAKAIVMSNTTLKLE